MFPAVAGPDACGGAVDGCGGFDGGNSSLVAVKHHERESDSQKNALFHSEHPGRRHPGGAPRHGIEPTRPERMTSRESSCGQPTALDGSVDGHRLASIIRTGRQEPAGTGEKRRQQDLVAREDRERSSLGHREAAAVGQQWLSGHRGPPVTCCGGRRIGSRARGSPRSASKNSRRGIMTTSMAGRGPDLGIFPEHLSHQAFGPISGHRVTDLAARDEPEPRFACCVRGNDERDIAAMRAGADRERALELGTPANPAVSAETLGLH